jgi:hypothetical protein
MRVTACAAFAIVTCVGMARADERTIVLNGRHYVFDLPASFKPVSGTQTDVKSYRHDAGAKFVLVNFGEGAGSVDETASRWSSLPTTDTQRGVTYENRFRRISPSVVSFDRTIIYPSRGHRIVSFTAQSNCPTGCRLMVFIHISDPGLTRIGQSVIASIERSLVRGDFLPR